MVSHQLDIVGLICVAITLVAYALEELGPVWVLVFAGGSFSSGIYALLQGAWPFAIAEAVWTVIALRPGPPPPTRSAPGGSWPG